MSSRPGASTVPPSRPGPASSSQASTAWLLDEYDGVAELIDRVHHAGLDTAALSNTNHEHWTRMGDFPAVMRLRHLLPSHHLGLHKPDPTIYRRLERQLGYGAGEILFFDDTPENIDGARAVGWDAQLIDPTADPSQQIGEALRDHGVAV